MRRPSAPRLVAATCAAIAALLFIAAASDPRPKLYIKERFGSFMEALRTDPLYGRIMRPCVCYINGTRFNNPLCIPEIPPCITVRYESGATLQVCR